MDCSWAQFWIQVWKEHASEKVPLWIEDLWHSVQGLPSGDSGCKRLLTELRRTIIMVTVSSEARRL